LLELSIVLVIFGVIVGGIFVGRDMFEAARIRSTISSKEAFDAATLSFLGKYKALPGDISAAAGYAGLATRTKANARGDGDWMIEQSYNTSIPSLANQCGENLLFWNDLYTANLIQVAGNASVDGCPARIIYPDGGLPSYLPKSKWSGDVYFFLFRGDVTNRPRTHHYGLAAVDYITTSGQIFMPGKVSYPIPVSAAQMIDIKMDDGLPQAGIVQSRAYSDAETGWGAYVTAESNNCSSGGVYLTTGKGCALMFEAKF